MNKEKQRVVIAEVCGWKECTRVGYEGFWKPADYVYNKSSYSLLRRLGQLPDYFNDLNAMAQAEKTLNEGKQREYLYHLCGSQRAEDAFLYATAPQRAEAFLRTIGKWEDGE